MDATEVTDIYCKHGKIPFLILQVFKSIDHFEKFPKNLAEYGLLHPDVLEHIRDVYLLCSSANKLHNRSIYLTSGLRHRLHGHYNDILNVTLHLEQCKKNNSSIDLTLHILLPSKSHFTEDVVMLNSGTDEWSPLFDYYHNLLNMDEVLSDLNSELKKDDKDKLVDDVRKNVQRGYGYASLNWKDDDVTSISRPEAKKNNCKESCRRTVIMNKILVALLRDAATKERMHNFRIDGHTGDVSDMMFDERSDRITQFGAAIVKGSGFAGAADSEVKLPNIFDVLGTSKAHYDIFNGAGLGGIVLTASSVLPARGEVHSVPHMSKEHQRVATICTDRSSIDSFMKRKSMAEERVDSAVSYYEKLDESQRECSGAYLALRPTGEEGFRPLVAHADKFFGYISLLIWGVATFLKDYATLVKRKPTEVELCEVTLPVTYTNKPMNYVNALRCACKKLIEAQGALPVDSLFELICRSYMDIGGNVSGGHYQRHQPSCNVPIQRSEAYGSLQCLLGVVQQIRLYPEKKI